MTRSHSCFFEIEQRDQRLHPRVVDEDVDAAVALRCRVHQGSHLRVPAHVRVHRDRFASALRHQVRRAPRRREVEIGGHDAGALFRESQRNSPTVARTGAGNDGNAIFGVA